MMRISTLLTALAVTLAASALATPSFAQRSEGMSGNRASSIHDCNARVKKFIEHTWGDVEIYKYRACMAQHHQEE